VKLICTLKGTDGMIQQIRIGITVT